MPPPLLRTLLSDAKTEALLGDDGMLTGMLKVEVALAKVQANLGVIPEAAAQDIVDGLQGFLPDLAGLRAGMRKDGVPVPALVHQLRSHLQHGGAVTGASYLHWGATTQDIVDTALLLQLRSLLQLLEQRLRALISALVATLAEAHPQTPLAARTRFQQALPTLFSLKVAGWIAPLLRHLERLDQLAPRLFMVQLGGAAGTLASMQDRGAEVMQALAVELDLKTPLLPWHNQRDGMFELAALLANIAGSLGKLGTDLLMMAQNEVGEVREGAGGGGGSSTMPNKSNPIRCEALISIARHTGTLLGDMAQAMLHTAERDGAAWQLEWAALSDLASATMASLAHGSQLIGELQVNAGAMRANLEASQGLMLAEAATFALSQHMPRGESQDLVKKACQQAIADKRDLFEILPGLTKAPVDWAKVRDPLNYLGSAQTFVDAVLKSAQEVAGGA